MSESLRITGSLIFFVVVLTFVLYPRLRQRRLRHRTKEAWKELADAYGWKINLNPRKATVRIDGQQKSRLFDASTYVFSGTSWTTIITEIYNTQGIIAQAGLIERLLPLDDKQPKGKLARAKANNSLFDASYRIKGYPVDTLSDVLAEPNVQNAIKAIYPHNVPLFHHPIMQIEGGRLAIRIHKLVTDREEMSQLITKVCTLAQSIEESLDRGAQLHKEL